MDPLLWAAVLAGPVTWVLLWAGANGLWTPGGFASHGPSMESVHAGLQWPAWPPRLWILSPYRFVLTIALYPVLEEIVFRGALQPWLRDRLTAWTDSPPRPAAGSDVRAKAGLAARFAAPGVLANLITSAVFAIAHLYGHSPPWALATFFPSLVFGLFRDRYNSLSAPIALHVFYNAGYFSLVA